jgi:GT2 family glycosyltransferase
MVIDNGSTNDSVARIREAFPLVELIEAVDNLGFSGSRNIGIRRHWRKPQILQGS